MKDINLLPEEIKSYSSTSSAETVKSEKKSISALGVLITILVLIIIAATIVTPKLYLNYIDAQNSKVIQEISSQKYQELNNVNAQLDQINNSILQKGAILSAIDEKTVSVAEILNSIKRATPKDCLISQIGLDKGNLTISGYSKSALHIAELISNLDRLEYFSRVGKTDSVSYDQTDKVHKFSIGYSIIGKDGK